jgi:hypothetical protein
MSENENVGMKRGREIKNYRSEKKANLSMKTDNGKWMKQKQ